MAAKSHRLMSASYCCSLVAAVLGVAAPALGQPGPGLHSFLDACEVTDAHLREVARSSCALISRDIMTPSDKNATSYKIEARPFVQIPLDTYPLCADSRFYGQPSYVQGRSGVLVGPDLVLTARHFVDPVATYSCVGQWYVVFDYAMLCDFSGAPLPPPLSDFPGELVYECAEIVRHGAFDDNDDLLLIRLDRPVTDRLPIPVRRGAPSAAQAFAAVHHPLQLPTKVDTLLSFLYQQQIPGASNVWSFQGAHVVGGSSGGMIYNLDERVVETAIRGGGGCYSYELTPAGCRRLTSACDNFGTIGTSVVNFARHINEFELAIQHPTAVQFDIPERLPPLFQPRVPHVGPVGGPVSNPVVSYRISAPPLAQQTIPVLWEVISPPGGPGLSVTVIQVGGAEPGNLIELDPGEDVQLRATVSVGAIRAGIYESVIKLTNQLNGNVDFLRHRFEIGLTGFEVSPPDPFIVNDPVPPFPQTKSYTVTNIHPSPVTVRVEAGASWLSINGVAAPDPGSPVSQSVTLAPQSQPGSEATFTVGIGNLAGLAFPGTHTSEVRFINTATGPAAGGNTARSASFSTLEAVYALLGHAAEIPDGDPLGLETQLVVPDGFCIGDLDVAIEISTPQCGGEGDGSAGSAAQLIVELVPPQGEKIRLWDHHPGSSIRLTFDDETNPAPTGALLSDFDHLSAEGVWTLRIIDDVPGATFMRCAWRLEFDSEGLAPCGP